MNHTFRQAIRRALKDSGRSLYEVAAAAGVPYSTAHNIIHSDYDVRISGAEKLAKELGVECKPPR